MLTIDIDGRIQTDDELAEIAWHKINNAYRTKKILTGMIGGIEQMDKGKTARVTDIIEVIHIILLAY